MFSSWSRIRYCSSFTYTQQYSSCSAPGPGSGTAAPSPTHSSTDHVQLLVRIRYCDFYICTKQYSSCSVSGTGSGTIALSQSSTVYTYFALVRKGKEPLFFFIFYWQYNVHERKKYLTCFIMSRCLFARVDVCSFKLLNWKTEMSFGYLIKP